MICCNRPDVRYNEDTGNIEYWDGSTWTPYVSSWLLTGNSGTTPSTNFLGTTDNNGIAFKVNNQHAGFINSRTDGIVTQGGFASFGQYAGNNMIPMINAGTRPDGRLNTLIGHAAGYNIGSTHDGVGTPSGENVFVGNWAGYFVQNVGRNGFGRNVFIGQSAGFRGVGSGENTGVGCFALEVVNKGVVNVGLGRDALRSTIDGDENVGLGGLSLVYSSTGVRSVTITNGGSGYTTATVTFSAPYAGGPGLCNATATGTAVISGGAIIGVDITNPGCGYSQYGGTLYPGFSHPAVTVTITGDGAGATATANLQSASYNTSAGGSAGLGNRVGRYNSYFGYHSGTGQTRYWDLYNTLIGAYTDIDSSVTATTAIEKSTAIGYGAKVAKSNAIVLGATGADQPNVGVGTISPDDSAIVDLTSTTRGFLPPRMTGVQAEAIVSPTEGLLVYSTDGSGVTITSKGWWGYEGATWVKLN